MFKKVSTNYFLFKNSEKWANLGFWTSKSGKRHDNMPDFRLIISKLAVGACHFPELRNFKLIFYVFATFFLVGGSNKNIFYCFASVLIIVFVVLLYNETETAMREKKAQKIATIQFRTAKDVSKKEVFIMTI
jgi:hypothetical protein